MKNYDIEKNKIVHKIYNYEYSIEGQQDYIRKALYTGKSINFKNIFENLENRIQAVVTFIALLELLNLHQIKVIQGEGVNNFWLELHNNDEEE
jgi:segregation and condensation protein A